MSNSFPITIPDHLPTKITPCSIVESVFELRFVTTESWRTLPGLLYAAIREKYPEQKDLPLARLDDEFRRQDSALTYLPLMRFSSERFIIQFGPRVVSLVTKTNAYPGWLAIEGELKWLLERIQEAGFVREGERLSVRYIDFFTMNIFSGLKLDVRIDDHPLSAGELHVATVLRRPPFVVRAQIANNAIVGLGAEAKTGSILDLDVWLGPMDFELFTNGLAKFGEAHALVKQVFFGLMRDEFLTSFAPEYK